MRRAGSLLADTFLQIIDLVKAGTETIEVDRKAEELIRSANAVPAFKGYTGGSKNAFPATVCISFEEEVVHGIPSQRKFKSGQIVGLDMGLILNGWHADMAVSILIDEVDDEHRKLWRVTRDALYKGIEQARPGNRISAIGSAVQEYAEKHNFAVIRDLVGHGIGSKLHEDPSVPNYYLKEASTKLKSGMTLAIEPMVSTGDWRISI